jgi:acyl-CoA reductase-like NAD-dependent aldehyde dehydrogenase
MTKADLKIYQHFIDGAYVDPVGGEWFDTLDPFRGEAWARIPRGTAADADLAVRSAARAMYQGPWATMTPSARGKLMRKLGDLVALNAERLASIEVRDRSGGGTTAAWPTRSRALSSPSTRPTSSRSRVTSQSAWWRLSRRGIRRYCSWH